MYFKYALGLVSFDTLRDIVAGIQAEDKDKWYKKLFRTDKVHGKESLKKDRTDYVIDSPADKHKYILAPCCNPIAGDSVVGFLSPDTGIITVHKKSCERAQSLASKYGEWIVMPRWAEDEKQSYVVRVSIKGVDRVGMLNEITRYISLVMEVNIKRLNLGSDNGLFTGSIDLEVQNKDALERIIKKLKSIDGIQSVMRSDI